MRNYIGFLRGINVGGNHKISMPVLKECFEENGFQNVITYLNSGNVIFSTQELDERKLKEDCERLILKKFNLNISVMIISAEDFLAAAEHAPLWWDQDEKSKHNAIFILPTVTLEEVFKKVGEAKPEYEKVGYYGNVIFWSAPIQTFSKTRWSKVVGSAVYQYITIRNANTIKKITQLVKELN